MPTLKNSSIKRRLTLIIMAISSISVLLTTLAISIIGVYNIRDNMIAEMDSLASISGKSNSAALSFDIYDKVSDNLNAFDGKKAIVQACLYDHQTMIGEVVDKPVGHYENPDIPGAKECPTELSEYTTLGKTNLAMMREITKNGEKIGYIYLESTLKQVDDYIEKQISIALLVALAVLLISYLLAIKLQNAISRPILRLADTARQVSVRKDYSIRAESLGDINKEYNNELVILTDSFNEMLTEIAKRSEQLKKQNTELEKAKDLAESANRAKSHFLANISHELRTPLNAVIGFSSILMNQLFGPLGDQKYLEYARDINESGAHLLDIINDILDLSKAEAGKLVLNYEEVHIGKAINKCVTIVAERAEKGGVAITTNVPKMLPPLVVDRLRFIQVLLNILSNAVKFTPAGGNVHIAVFAEARPSGQTDIIVTMQDTGIGMTALDIEQAFQSFGQVDSGLNRKYEGTGLGLPLTKKLMELHHGTIDMVSELEKGTLVTLTFPALPPEGAYNPND